MVSFWQRPARFVIGATDGLGREPDAHSTDPVVHMMHADTRQYLPDDILVKVDRAAMAVSLETRVPFLDPRVAEAAWRIPSSIHLRDGRGKWVLRQILERHVPREWFDRPKSGFAVPLARWLRGELKDWAADLLDPVRMRAEGYFVTAQIERRWHQHLAGRMNWSSHLWGVLMFQSWLEDFERTSGLERDPAPPELMSQHASEPVVSIR
jgi:asparagine synthase (glutamine-hydrolysing)